MWAAGASTFAGALMLVAGTFQFFQGLTALINGNDFLIRTQNYIFTFNASTWGWIHLLLGLGVAVAGVFIFRGNVAARAVGIGLAVISAIANFMWLPYYPLWGLTIIALDIFVIWGLSKVSLADF
jgi:hypothetical protein